MDMDPESLIEALTGHCLSLWRPDGVTHAWCPNPRGLALCHFCQPQWYTLDFTHSHWGFPLRTVNIHQLTKAGFTHPAESKQNASWIKASESDEERGDLKARINHPLVVKQLAWHEKEDSLATVALDAK
ncbi:hypothetical protein G6F43_000483 [Rhizopus delemar]|nr:hypothetical protein G6F43_000483 [Rhizopus delemar]